MASRNECQVNKIVRSRKCRRVPVSVYTRENFSVKLCPTCGQLQRRGLIAAGYTTASAKAAA
jgi:predicted RNA-binding Zn-ribbon protein involved in translation (DUF1610 family)